MCMCAHPGSCSQVHLARTVSTDACVLDVPKVLIQAKGENYL